MLGEFVRKKLGAFSLGILLISMSLIPIAKAAVIVDDSFDRADANGWGTADTGGTWNVSYSNEVKIASNKGRIYPTSGNWRRCAWIASGTTDVEITGTTTPSITAYMSAYIGARTDWACGLTTGYANAYYAKIIDSETDNIYIYTVNSGTNTSLGSTTTTINTFAFRFRVEDNGSDTDVSLSVWEDGGSEPGSWTLSATDTTTDHASGYVGAMVNHGGGTRGYNFDDFYADDLTSVANTTTTLYGSTIRGATITSGT